MAICLQLLPPCLGDPDPQNQPKSLAKSSRFGCSFLWLSFVAKNSVLLHSPFVKRRLLWRIVPFVAARAHCQLWFMDPRATPQAQSEQHHPGLGKEALPCLLCVWHLQWAHSLRGRLPPHQHRQSPYTVSRPLSTRKRKLMTKQPGARKCVAKHVPTR
jgi:hypothetical protein